MHMKSRTPAPFGLNPAAILNAMEKSLVPGDSSTYPPFNIVQDGDDRFTIEMAVAGFSEDQISIQVEKQNLVIEASPAGADKRSFLHKGIAQRAFRRVFRLGEHVQVRDASLTNGLLAVSLERVLPEQARPRQIAITRH